MAYLCLCWLQFSAIKLLFQQSYSRNKCVILKKHPLHCLCNLIRLFHSFWTLMQACAVSVQVRLQDSRSVRDRLDRASVASSVRRRQRRVRAAIRQKPPSDIRSAARLYWRREGPSPRPQPHPPSLTVIPLSSSTCLFSAGKKIARNFGVI